MSSDNKWFKFSAERYGFGSEEDAGRYCARSAFSSRALSWTHDRTIIDDLETKGSDTFSLAEEIRSKSVIEKLKNLIDSHGLASVADALAKICNTEAAP